MLVESLEEVCLYLSKTGRKYLKKCLDGRELVFSFVFRWSSHFNRRNIIKGFILPIIGAEINVNF